MADMGDHFRDIREMRSQMRRKRTEEAGISLAPSTPGGEGWTRHTPHHYSRTLAGKRLDYWPSTNRWQWDGRIIRGAPRDLNSFIRNRESAIEKDRPHG